MNYAEMSDVEVAKLVAIRLGAEEIVPGLLMDIENKIRYDVEPPKRGKPGKFFFDPCNNPADMWPLIVSQKISLNMDGCLPCAYKDEIYDSSGLIVGYDYFFEHTNPLRAAAIVYLMMKEVGK